MNRLLNTRTIAMSTMTFRRERLRLWLQRQLQGAAALTLLIACSDGDGTPNGAAGGSAGGSVDAGTQVPRDWCELQLPRPECVGPELTDGPEPTDELIEDFLSECRSTHAETIEHLREEHRTALRRCVDELPCAEFEDLDDICFPYAVTVAHDGAASGPVSACIEGIEQAGFDPPYDAATEQACDQIEWSGVIIDECQPALESCVSSHLKNRCIGLTALEPSQRTEALACWEGAPSCDDMGACLTQMGAFGW